MTVNLEPEELVELGTSVDTGEEISARETIRSGLAFSPELGAGFGWTLLLAAVGTAGRVVVPIAVQQTLDHGLDGTDVDLSFVLRMTAVAAFAIVATGVSSYFMTARLFTASERGLATLRIKAFRHVHDLPLLTQSTEHRGALVSRVTSDVDQVSQFLVFGGVFGIISVGQVLLATVVMLFYSWQLTIVVWVCFLPLFLSLQYFQRRLSAAYGLVRRSVGAMLTAISEPVVGAVTVRTYAIEQRTQERIDEAVAVNQAAATRAQGLTAFSFSLGGLSAGLANAGVLIIGIWLGFADEITSGQVIGFAFLVTLFVGPVQMGTQVLTDAQNAIAGWRRVIGILETPADLDDPGPSGRSLPRGAMDVAFEDVSFGYPGGPLVLRDVSEHVESGSRIAVVGETGSGKTTFAKLLTRLMDPTVGSRAPRRRRPDHRGVRLAAPAGGAGAAGGLPVRLHAAATTCATATSTRPPSGSWPPRPSSASATGSTGCPTVSTPGWASAASRYRLGSVSSSHCSGPTWPTRTCSSSTRRPARSTPRWRCASPGPWSG